MVVTGGLEKRALLYFRPNGEARIWRPTPKRTWKGGVKFRRALLSEGLLAGRSPEFAGYECSARAVISDAPAGDAADAIYIGGVRLSEAAP